MVECLPLLQVLIPGFWDWVLLHQAPYKEPASPSVYLLLSLCLSWINKILKKKQRVGSPEASGLGDGVTGWWALRRPCDVMSTGCYIRLMNHWTLPLKLIIHYMLINWIQILKNCQNKGCLGGSVGWASISWFQLRSWSQGHAIKPCKGLCAQWGIYFRLCLHPFPSATPSNK